MNRCLETLIVRLLNEMLFLARASLSHGYSQGIHRLPGAGWMVRLRGRVEVLWIVWAWLESVLFGQCFCFSGSFPAF